METNQIKPTSEKTDSQNNNKNVSQETEIKSELASFTGTEQYFRHWMRFVYTDGVKYLAERCGCYWLLDAIGSYQHKPKIKTAPFQIWTLNVNNEEKSAVLEMKEDSGQPVLVRQEIKYTDFPLSEIKLYYIEGVLLLTSEY